MKSDKEGIKKWLAYQFDFASFRLTICAIFTAALYFIIWPIIPEIFSNEDLPKLEGWCACCIIVAIATLLDGKQGKIWRWIKFMLCGISLTLVMCVLVIADYNTLLKLFIFYVCVFTVCLCEKYLFEKEHIADKNEEDRLSRSYMYAGVYAWIRKSSITIKEGKAIAILGDWGSGKTHLRHYLENRLRDVHYEKIEDSQRVTSQGEFYNEKYAIGNINLWRTHNFEEAWHQIEFELLKIIEQKDIIREKHCLPMIGWLLKSILKIDTDIVRAVEEIIANNGNNDTSQYALQISNKLEHNKNKRHAILFFDDIERADIAIIEALLPLIERLKQISRLTIVCNISIDVLCEKMMRSNYSRESVCGQLSKIFDITFNLPEISNESRMEMRDSMMAENEKMYPKTCEFWRSHQIEFPTPRDLERIFSKWCSIEWMYLSNSEDEEWKERFSVKTIFLSVALKMISPSIAQELIDSNPESFFRAYQQYRTGFPSGNQRWIEAHSDFIRVVRSRGCVRSIINYMSELNNKSDFARLNRALRGEYTARLSIPEHLIETVLIGEKGIFDGRVKTLIQNKFKGSVPVLMHKSITDVYRYSIAKFSKHPKYSKAISTSLKHELFNSHRIDDDEKMPWQLSLNFVVHVLNAYLDSHDLSTVCNFYASIRHSLFHSNIVIVSSFIKYLTNDKFTPHYFTPDDAKLYVDVRKRLGAGANHFISKACFYYGFIFCRFLIGCYNIKNYKDSKVAKFDTNIISLPRTVIDSSHYRKCIMRGCAYFASKYDKILVLLQSCAIRYLRTPKPFPSTNSTQLVATELDCFICSHIFKISDTPDYLAKVKSEHSQFANELTQLISDLSSGNYIDLSFNQSIYVRTPTRAQRDLEKILRAFNEDISRLFHNNS
ncbi:MAG: P-loop NTPase fold protein [Akkermansia sp.]|nr:P-loop NTPase fold protein [Akkermansia sp.]